MAADRLTPFEKAVLEEVGQIPEGRVSTYKAIASKLGRPGAARAVGNALNKNPFPVKTPCHRVLKSDGSLGGYKGGAREKERLLEEEGLNFWEGRLEDFHEKLI